MKRQETTYSAEEEHLNNLIIHHMQSMVIGILHQFKPELRVTSVSIDEHSVSLLPNGKSGTIGILFDVEERETKRTRQARGSYEHKTKKN
jgi:hypothetical protein